MTREVELPGQRAASYHVIGDRTPALMFAGGPGFTAAYMDGDAELFSAVLRPTCSTRRLGMLHTPGRSGRLLTRGPRPLYEEVRRALGLPKVVVLGHSFGATTALAYAALFPDAVQACVAVAAFGVGPEADAREGGQAEAEGEAMLLRHADSPWYTAARPVMDEWTERILGATDPWRWSR